MASLTIQPDCTCEVFLGTNASLCICRLNVSMDAVIERDGRVWQRCRSTNTPVCMLLSGGYASTSCQTVIASLASILAGQSTSDASIVSARTPPSM